MNILALSFLMFIPFFGANAQKLDEKPTHEKSCIYKMGLGNNVQEHNKNALIKRGGGTLISLSVLYEGQTVDLCAKVEKLCSTKEPDSLQHAPPPPTKVEKSPAKH